MDAAREMQGLGADVGPATVVAPSGARAVMRFEDGATGEAAIAIDGYEPRAGDRLLVARGRSGAWAFAVLSALREATPVRADDGASAQLEDGALTVRDGAGRLLFSHHPDEGVSVVHAPHGSLRLSAPEGDIELAAGRDVRVGGARDVEVTGKRVAVSAPTRSGDENGLRFDRRGARLETPALTASAKEARLALLETTFAATHVTTAIATARHAYGVVETRAERIVERAKDTYREVEELAQTKAGRIRQIAARTVHLLSERTVVKAKDEVAIKGEKIHLA